MIDICVKNVEGVWFGAACENEYVFATTFTLSEKDALQSLMGGIPFGAVFQRADKPSGFAERVIGFIKDVYDGKGGSCTFSLNMKHLSDYNKKVLEIASLIPAGYVSSYGAVSKIVGGAPRAVGHMMATNPFAPIVPCHRIVGSDFSLVGYGGGLDLKLAFLRREKRGYTSKKEISVNGKKLSIFPAEFVLQKVEKR